MLGRASGALLLLLQSPSVSPGVCWVLLVGLQVAVALTLCLLTLQRVGYLAASQCFHEGTDVIMLTTNQIRKVGPDAFWSLMSHRSPEGPTCLGQLFKAVSLLISPVFQQMGDVV